MERQATGVGTGDTADDIIDSALAVDDAIAAESATPTEPKSLVAMSREQFIARSQEFKKRPTVERVSLPWIGPGAHAFVRGMTSRERDDFETSLFARDRDGKETNHVTSDNIRAKFLVRVLCNSDGVRLFADHETDLISGVDAKTADALYDKGRALSGVTQADVEEMQKNSGSALSVATSSRSESKSSDASRTS